MYYKEWLRARSFFIKYALIATGIIVVILLLTAPPGTVTVDTGSAQYHVGSSGVHTTTNIEAPGIAVHDVNHGAPIGLLFALAGLAASIFAMCLGTSLSCENHGHLEFAWTRPTSRAGYALRVMGIDLVAALAAFAFAFGIGAAFVGIRGWWPYLHADQNLPLTIARFAFYPVAWYALISAITASLRSNAGIAVGLTWVFNAWLLLLVGLKLPPVMHAVVSVLMYLNPMAYGSWVDSATASQTLHTFAGAPLLPIGGLLGISVLGVGAALLQWRRLEA